MGWELLRDGAKMTLSAFIELYKKLKAEFDSLEVVEVKDEQLSNEAEGEEEDDSLDESGDSDEDEDSEESGDLDEEDLDALDAADAEAEAAPAPKLDNAKGAVKKKAVKKGSVAKKLKNAADNAASTASHGTVVDLTSDQIKRGAERYGSKK